MAKTELIISNVLTDFLVNPIGSNETFRVESISISNTDTENEVQVDITMLRDSNELAPLTTVSVPAHSTITTNYPYLFLDEGCSIKLISSVNDGVHAIVNYEIR